MWSPTSVIETKPLQTYKSTNQTSSPSAIQRSAVSPLQFPKVLIQSIQPNTPLRGQQPFRAIPCISLPCSQDQPVLMSIADHTVNTWLSEFLTLLPVYVFISQAATSVQASRLQFCIHFSSRPSRYIYSLFHSPQLYNYNIRRSLQMRRSCSNFLHPPVTFFLYCLYNLHYCSLISTKSPSPVGLTVLS